MTDGDWDVLVWPPPARHVLSRPAAGDGITVNDEPYVIADVRYDSGGGMQLTAYPMIRSESGTTRKE